MWCDKCKHSREIIPEEVEVIIVKPDENIEARGYLDQVIITEEEVKQGLDVEQLKKQQIERIKRTYSTLKGTFPLVLWCSKKRTFVVCNPEKPTTMVDMEKECPFFEPK